MMTTTRREWLQGMARAASTVVAGVAFPEALRAQSDNDRITRQLRADLEQHAAFGDKFSGGAVRAAGGALPRSWDRANGPPRGQRRGTRDRDRHRDAVERNGTLVMLDIADPQRSLMVTDAARAAAAEGFKGLSGLERPTGVQPSAGELSTFTDLGYTTAFAVLGVHRWFHTVEDTLERVDARLLVPVLTAHQRTIERLVEPA
jgi:hypothetical protein